MCTRVDSGFTRGQRLTTTSAKRERREHTMSANKLIRNPLWATLLAALVAAMVSYLVFVSGSEAAPAADGKYSPYVINGEPVPNGKYPFMAALIDQSRPGTI